jgi:hypothetical protein
MGFSGSPQAVENDGIFIFHSPLKATEIHGQPKFLSPFFSPLNRGDT